MRLKRHAKLVLAAAVLVVVTAPTPEVLAQDSWQWSPYMWATDINEDLILDGEVVGGDDTDFSDLVDKIDSSIQLHFEGTRERWGLFADVSYVDLSDSEVGEMGLVRFDVEIEETVWEAGAIFRPGGRSGTVDLLFGARNLAINEIYRLQFVDIGGREAQIDENYLDALVGVRWHIPLAERWIISLRGDVSAGGTDYMWTAQGLLGWRFGKHRNSAVFLGYRYRRMKYSKADVLEDEKVLFGPGLGIKIGF